MSNRTLSGTDQIPCTDPDCHQLFNTVRGRNIHFTKKHGKGRSSNSITNFENDDQCTPNAGPSQQNRMLCTVSNCNKSCSGTVGLTSHFRQAHPVLHINQIANKYDSPAPNTTSECEESTPVDSPRSTTRKNENEQIQEIMANYENDLQVLLSESINTDKLDGITDKLFVEFRNIIKLLPGPQHPASKFYEARKKKQQFQSDHRTFSTTTNPQRKSKRERQRRKEQYNYDLCQFLYYNQRKKLVQRIINTQGYEPCKIPTADLYDSFKSRWCVKNSKVLHQYETVEPEEQKTLDEDFLDRFSEEDVKAAMKNMNIDTSPGPDHIYMRTLKLVKCEKVIALLATIMLQWSYVPKIMKEAKTILIYKGGDKSDPGNWRPISIQSIIRRIIERILDRHLRKFITFNNNQRGFTKHFGTLINTNILDGCLKHAKSSETDITIVLLDIIKAYDNIGHDHLKNCLLSAKLPSVLRNLIINLIDDNFTRIQACGSQSKPISFLRGVLQGSPLSPSLFNLSIDFILRQLSETELSEKYGFQLTPELPNLSVTGFADDTCVIGNSKGSAIELTSMAKHLFNSIGLDISAKKCIAITLIEGELLEDTLQIDNETTIRSIRNNESVRYLGVPFTDEIIFDEKKVICNLKNDLNTLSSSAVLRPDQKLNILNQFICPKLTYPFQMAPFAKIKKDFLEDVDIIFRSTIKTIIGLPNDTPNSMLYSPRRYKGLGLLRANWECYIQIINSCVHLKKESNPHINFTRCLDTDIEKCRIALKLEDNCSAFSGNEKTLGQRIRNHLRNKEFDIWCNLKQKGIGVILYKECPKSNNWVFSKFGLSCSEWTNAIKMSCNTLAVRSIPGRSTDGPLCRHGCKESETLGHVLGSCPKNSLLINARHHKVRNLIAEALRVKKFEVLEEVTCVALNGSTRRVDILCFNPVTRKGWIFDPTVRFENHEGQALEVDQEKKAIYEPCIPYLLSNYNLLHLDVIGLFIGSRGTIPKFFDEFRKSMNLPHSLTEDISLTVIRSSLHIHHNHTYNPI
jgi:hypothetical protein